MRFTVCDVKGIDNGLHVIVSIPRVQEHLGEKWHEITNKSPASPCCSEGRLHAHSRVETHGSLLVGLDQQMQTTKPAAQPLQ